MTTKQMYELENKHAADLRKKRRREKEATFPKCKQCGNVLGVERANAGIKRCRGCMSDEELADRDALTHLRFHVAPYIQDPHARDCIIKLLNIVARGNV